MARKKKQYSGYKTTPPKNIEIKEIIKETKEDFGVRQEKRYIIIDSETGKIFDDAQGYGYKSKRSAIAKYAYASKSKEELQNIEKDKLDVQKFWGMHKETVENLHINQNSQMQKNRAEMQKSKNR